MSASEPVQAQLKQVIAPHIDAVYNLSRWLAGNDTDAENIALQVCLRTLRLPGAFVGTNGRSWLLAMVRNTAYAWLRQHRPEAVVSVKNAESDPVALANQLAAVHDVARDELRVAVESLPLQLRETLVLRELEGLSYKEIADVTEVPVGAVMSRLANARKQLLEHLGRKGH